MAVQSTDKFLVNRAGVSYQAPFTSLTQGVTTDITIGTSDADGAHVMINSTKNVEFPNIALRRSASNGTDIKMMSFILGADDNESTNLYNSCNIALSVASTVTASDTSVAKNAQLTLNAPNAVNLGVNGAKRFTVKSDGTINFANVLVYEDNNSAKTAGLRTGDVYRKATGELMIVF